jgi:hypothetical protein
LPHAHRPLGQGDVRDLEPGQLGDSDRAFEQQADDQAVPGTRLVAGRQEPPEFVQGKHVG